MADYSFFSAVTAYLATTCYGISAWLLWRSSVQQHSLSASVLLGSAALALHIASLVLGIWQYQSISSSFFDALSLTAIIVVIVATLSQWPQRILTLLIPVYLIAAASVLSSTLFSHHTPIAANSIGMLAHIICSIIAYSLLCLASLQAIALHLSDKNLKKGSASSWLSTLPPLQSMEAFLFQLIVLGLLTLTLAIVSGALFVDNLFAQQLVHKSVFSILSWLLLSGLLLGRFRYGWRGTTAVKWTLGAFLTLAIAYLGSKFVLDIILQRL